MSIFQLLNGLTFAALLFVVASGFTLIFGLLRIVNLAHGALYLFGGYIGFTVAVKTGSFVLGGVGAMAAIAAIGLRARPGSAALRARQRAAAGAADARRRVRAQRSRARDLGRRQLHGADPADAARRPCVCSACSIRPIACSCWSSAILVFVGAVAAAQPYAARRADPRRRRRRRNGGSIGRQHPPGVSRHLPARLGAGRPWRVDGRRVSFALSVGRCRDPRVQPRGGDHRRARQPGRRRRSAACWSACSTRSGR